MRLIIIISLLVVTLGGCEGEGKQQDLQPLPRYETVDHQNCRSSISDRFVISDRDSIAIRKGLHDFSSRHMIPIRDVLERYCYGYIRVGQTYCVGIFSIGLDDEEDMFCYRQSTSAR